MDLLTNIFSLNILAKITKPNATIINLNDREAKGLADWTIIWPLINAELQKNTNKNGKKFNMEYIYRLLIKIKNYKEIYVNTRKI